MTTRRDLAPKLQAVLSGELRCTACGFRSPASKSHRRCWQCSRNGDGQPPPCKGCGGPQWFSGWCQDCHPRLRPPLSEPRSCRSCFAWGLLGGRTCKACLAFAQRRAVGICAGCHREMPLHRSHCRLCHQQAQYLAGPQQWDTGPLHFHELGPSGQQLFLANTLAIGWGSRRRTTHRPPASALPEPDALAQAVQGPVQPELFALPFTGPPWLIAADDAPRLDWYGHLVPAVARIGELRGWNKPIQEHVRNTLRSLVATQPPDLRVYPASAVARLGPGHRHSTARTLELLQQLSLLVDDRTDRNYVWAEKRLAKLPPAFRKEVEPWLDRLRHGDARHQPKRQGTWRGYLTDIMPVLLCWASRYDHLRDVTRDDVLAALTEPRPRGGDNHTRAIALRSMFGFLKARKRIFANPTRRLPAEIGRGYRHSPPVTARKSPPATHEAMSPQQWLVTVLIRHHALPGTTIVNLVLDDIDLQCGVLVIARQRRPLDKLTRDAITGYLAYRTARWPLTANHHLVLSKLSALGTGPVSSWWISEQIRLWKSTISELRQDRILEEAAASAIRDPMHLAMMFGLHPNTAQRYVDAVHPRYKLTPGYVHES